VLEIAIPKQTRAKENPGVTLLQLGYFGIRNLDLRTTLQGRIVL
jgi:hypothetical protein